NTFRFMEEKGYPPFKAATLATADIGHAVLATTLSLAVIFIPVSFMSSMACRFLYQFGITAAAAVMVSLLVSFTLTPMMCARMLHVSGSSESSHGGHDSAGSRRGFYRWIDAGYMASLRFSMKHRMFVAVLGLAVIGLSVPMYRLIRQDYLPTNVEDGQFEVRATSPEGVSLAAMDEVMRAVEGKLMSTPGISIVLGSTGGDYNGSLSSGRIWVQLIPHSERVFSWVRLGEGVLHGDPFEAFRGNFSQRDVMQNV